MRTFFYRFRWECPMFGFVVLFNCFCSMRAHGLWQTTPERYKFNAQVLRILVPSCAPTWVSLDGFHYISSQLIKLYDTRIHKRLHSRRPQPIKENNRQKTFRGNSPRDVHRFSTAAALLSHSWQLCYAKLSMSAFSVSLSLLWPLDFVAASSLR